MDLTKNQSYGMFCTFQLRDNNHHSVSYNGLYIKSTRLSKRSITEIKCKATEQQLVLQASSMHETYDLLSQKLFATSLTSKNKYLVGIAGPPGAGKSTLTNAVVNKVNELNQKNSPEYSSDIAIAIPMDGFHLYKHQLDQMEDPKEAHARRGAPWTFNPAGLVESLSNLLDRRWGYFPSFDHGVGDPVERDILVTSKHKLVLVEGNYLLLDEGDWKRLATLFDERWFIDVDIDKAMQRVEKRHISTGKSREEARKRIEYNDRPNAELILKTKGRANLIINSIDM